MRHYNRIVPNMWIKDVAKTFNEICWPAKLSAAVMEVILDKFDELQTAFKPEFEALAKAEESYRLYGYGGAKPMKKPENIPAEHQQLIDRRKALSQESTDLDNQIDRLGYTRSYSGGVLVPCTLVEIEAARAEMAARKKSTDGRWTAAINQLTDIAKNLAVEKIKTTKVKLPANLVAQLEAITVPALPPATELAQLGEGQ